MSILKDLKLGKERQKTVPSEFFVRTLTKALEDPKFSEEQARRWIEDSLTTVNYPETISADKMISADVFVWIMVRLLGMTSGKLFDNNTVFFDHIRAILPIVNTEFGK